LAGAKVGHLGTLDPFATGLLPLAIGEGAKIAPFLNQGAKTYRGTIALGRATDTLDPTGRTTATAAVPTVDPERLEDVARRFRGSIEQVPPKFSALKRDGVPLYELARRGVEVEVGSRTVRIDSLSLTALSNEILGLSVRCSKGTYVRSLARDIAQALGTVGHLASLRRLTFGAFEVEGARPLEEIRPDSTLPLLGLREALAGIREFQADERMAARIRLGQQGALVELSPPAGLEEVAMLLDRRGRPVAVLGGSGARWKILRVFASSTRE
jgi:tRNA pseudouridine55 synthase